MVSPRRDSGSERPSLKDARILVVEARYYDDIADELLRGALDAIAAAGAEAEVVTVPGALEIPQTVAILVEAAARARKPFDAVVALGCVIRGETGHYDIVAGESARALMDLSVVLRLPLGNGILTVETEAQAQARARVAEMNKGGGAAEAALAVLGLKRARDAAQAERTIGFTPPRPTRDEGDTSR
ncbi:6,7-dimethyl-8-ribityllumazine synthase [Methylobacterium isbiliense]|jgi:6,7-dimethyl-8-ribityllumazine synthase|uniref:6,7-dimethyl-8-ribityllumazine synthase n=1 Tax=Methylobacterium isbiliense TaxID=315478 RepID=A0ABQ4SHP7_9HYPH|nr:6,7-dimethyl-8-ribityllumazine synthase [Methylobacterium isbiliense]MDN3624093.1 6,7-dimethyl-8-ribityllumazine synthase [Methylobacterium isbiliense]GJE01861.1 6,7-dimethyl-8-ribityllumazine synthase [Methylobacterium isbiliense]